MIPPATAKRMRLGDLLLERGHITPEQLEEALRRQREGGQRLGEILVAMKAVTEEDVARALAGRAGFPFARLRKGLVDPRVVDRVPREKAELYEVLPLFRIHDRLAVALSDPHRVHVIDTLRKLTGCQILPVVSPAEDIRRMIAESYADKEIAIHDLVPDLESGEIEVVSTEIGARFEDIAEMAGESPIINLVNQVLLKAIKERASDIHVEPEQKYMRVRFRIDGVLYEVMRQRIDLHAPVISRLKILANLDIAERRLPQDGRIQVLAQGRTVDLRFSSLPGVLGEKVVLRVLDREAGVRGLSELGFSTETLTLFRDLLRRPHGLVLVTGPTGSGKTTTLYAGLRELNSIEKNIVTIEDPVEYQFEIISQNQVREDIGLTFARILKHTLRQDPDIVMVGEIRDAETAEIAVQAALTGHLVLSTMHTNDAPSSISRLLEMDVEAYLLASSLIGVVSQRLVRTICPDCAVTYYATPAELEALGRAGQSGLQLKRGRGCTACFDSGYRGRLGIYELMPVDHEFQKLLLHNPTLELGIYELMPVDHEFQKLLLHNPTLDQIRDNLQARNLTNLRAEGLKRVLEGRTTLEEVARAVSVD